MTALNVGLGASRRRLQERAGMVCLLVRHTSSLVVALLCIVDTRLATQPEGHVLLTALVAWSLYRLVTRSLLWQFTVADFCWVVAVSASAASLVGSAVTFQTASPPAVIALLAVATFALQTGPAVSIPMTIVIGAACVRGAGHDVRWTDVSSLLDMTYLFVGAFAAMLIRLMIARIADAVDRARADRQAAEVGRSVSAARRHFDREQLALLHDTAAATLLMVGQQAAIPTDRLAAQAKRDLEALDRRPWITPETRVDLVDALQADVRHLKTPVAFTGSSSVWLGGQLADAVTAAAREVVTNIERHAGATHIGIDIRPGLVVITDDGVGFTLGADTGGQGIRASIVGRMDRVGGSGSVRSTPTKGTVVELSWSPPVPITAGDPTGEGDRSIGRIRAAFTLAMTAYAIVGLIATVPTLGSYVAHDSSQIGLTVLAGLCALSALPAVWFRERRPAWAAAAILAVIAVLQPALLSTHELTTDANWSQDVVGFCLLPLLLRWPTVRAAAVLIVYWAVPAVVALLRNPSEAMVVFLVLSVAGGLVPQLFASLFSTWAFQAAQEARTENDALVSVITAEKIAEAIQSDYVKRYGEILKDVVPILTSLSRGDAVTPELQRRARAESRRLRTLFERLRADHVLPFELRAVVESAEDRGVEVAVHFDGDFPELDQDDIDDIVLLTERLLALATTAARIVLTGTTEEVELSVVCEVAPENVDYQIDVDADTELVWSDTTAWLTKRHRPSKPDGHIKNPSERT